MSQVCKYPNSPGKFSANQVQATIIKRLPFPQNMSLTCVKHNAWDCYSNCDHYIARWLLVKSRFGNAFIWKALAAVRQRQDSEEAGKMNVWHGICTRVRGQVGPDGVTLGSLRDSFLRASGERAVREHSLGSNWLRRRRLVKVTWTHMFSESHKKAVSVATAANFLLVLWLKQDKTIWIPSLILTSLFLPGMLLAYLRAMVESLYHSLDRFIKNIF